MKKNFIKTTLVVFILLNTIAVSAVPKLNSYPSAAATIYLDFDGCSVTSAAWNQGNPIVCAPSGMTDVQITETFNRVAEDYRPFDINITTDSAVYMAAPFGKRIRIIVTTTHSWYPGVGGVAYVGSFLWGDDTPGFVFSAALGYGPKMVGEACSHESGHALGLTHQSRYDAGCNLTEVYNSGVGAGVTSWAPIMGNSYYRNMSGWQNGPTPYGCGETQDNLSILTSQNGFSYRPDDYVETLSSKTVPVNPVSFTVNGVIETAIDKDAFMFILSQKSVVKMNATPFSVGANETGANLDIKLMLYNAAGTLLQTYDPATAMGAKIDTTLNSGTYYLKIDGTGNANTPDYGSLGSYTISGFTATVLPIKSVVLTGNSDNNKHQLDWNIISNEPIRSVVIETSVDGINFVTFNQIEASTNSFIFQPKQNTINYYRLKVISAIGETAYSNVVALKSTERLTQNFIINRAVKNEIAITATAEFQYLLADMNGRIISKGKGVSGITKLSIDNQPNGIYVVQLMSHTTKQTERIIKY